MQNVLKTGIINIGRFYKCTLVLFDIKSLPLRRLFREIVMGTSKEMTSGTALPLIFNFAMPVLLANLLQQTYSLIDAAIVGKFLGIDAFSLSVPVLPSFFLSSGFVTGVVRDSAYR